MPHFKHVPVLVEFHRQRVETLRHTVDMPPPWEAFPDLPRDAMGWRMGSSEDFLIDWLIWLQALTVARRDVYRKCHPEPESWSGIYEQHFERFASEPHRKSWDEFWDDEFKKQYEMFGA